MKEKDATTALQVVAMDVCWMCLHVFSPTDQNKQYFWHTFTFCYTDDGIP